MPSFVKDEEAWSTAKRIVSKQRGRTENAFTDRDWGLANHIYHGIVKSSVDRILGDKEKTKVLLAHVEYLLEARRKKAKKGNDEDLPEDIAPIVEALKKVMGSGGQTIALLRQAESSGLEPQEVAALANELSGVATKLKKLLDSLK